jgi:hypothetical protein
MAKFRQPAHPEEDTMSLRLALFGLFMAASPALAFDTTKLGQWGSLGLEDIIRTRIPSEPRRAACS